MAHFKNRKKVVGLLILLVVFSFQGSAPTDAKDKGGPRERRFDFKIAADTPVKDLLPTPLKSSPKTPLYLNEDLTQVLELTFGQPVAGDTEKETAHIIAKINHLNAKEEDGFLKALLAARADLRGLPFMMGKACRTPTKQAQLFSEAATVVHQTKVEIRKDGDVREDVAPLDHFWRIYGQLWDQPTAKHRRAAGAEENDRAKVASLMQIFGRSSGFYQESLASYLAKIDHADATQALVQLALYSPEPKVRSTAVAGLKSRDQNNSTRLLVDGFHYPLPAVWRRAADAIVELKLTDAAAELINVLEQPDPRAPHKGPLNGKEAMLIRELVRVNHHRNCLLCHAPANDGPVPRDVLTPLVPLPDRALPTTPGGYGFGMSPDIFVRTDITYLRQDFSLMMDVENPDPWPRLQRFDFFVRTREVGAKEAERMVEALAKAGTPPSHQAAQFALRELTGQAPKNATPAEWRRLIKLMK